jgi:hypothetical protein
VDNCVVEPHAEAGETAADEEHEASHFDACSDQRPSSQECSILTHDDDFDSIKRRERDCKTSGCDGMDRDAWIGA